jgi:cell wall-associated NlpC family hydrolase
LKEVGAPIAADAASLIGTGSAGDAPLPTRAVDYAWFFGGVVAPFDTAGKRTGSLLTDDSESSPTPSGQNEVGSENCPKKAPKNTLRPAKAKIDLAKLCEDSVARARTPEAAKAIKWALNHLGMKYSQDLRETASYSDCSSFVMRAYKQSGAIPKLYGRWSPNTDGIRGAKWAVRIPLSKARPGDLVEPHSGHVAMQLADGYKVHNNSSHDVAHVEPDYSRAYWVGWIDPGKV